MINRKRKKTPFLILGDSVLTVLMICFGFIAIFPFLYMIIISLQNTTTMKLTLDRIINGAWTLDNYAKLMNSGSFKRYILNSVIMTVYASFVNCTVSSMAAYAFAKLKFSGRSNVYSIYLATMMVPGQVLIIPAFLICRNIGILNTFTAMALPTINAFGTIMIHSFIQGIPDDLLEAADIDGCSEAGKFVRIIIPLIKPALISLVIFTFVTVWGSLLWPLIVSNGDMMPVTVAVANMKSTKTVTQYGYVMAGTTVSFLPPFILYLFLQKQFVEGIALSGIKS